MSNLTLQTIDDGIVTDMVQPEQDLENTLNGLGNGSTMSVTDMMNLQFQMSKYSITGSAASAVMKEISDTLKGIVQKVG